MPPIISSNAFLISIAEINANLSMISMRIKCIDFLDNSPPFPSPPLPSPQAHSRVYPKEFPSYILYKVHTEPQPHFD